MSVVEPRPYLTASTAVVCAVVTLAPLPTVLKLPAALALCAWLPGSAIMGLVFRGASRPTGQVPLTVITSMAWTVLTGLLLNLAGWLGPVGWACSLGGTCLLTCSATSLLGVAPSDGDDGWEPRPVHALGLTVACVLATGAYLYARAGATGPDRYRYTEFWLVPAPGSPSAMTLGVRNAEQVATRYEVEVLDGTRTVGRWPAFALAPGETWTAPVTAVATSTKGRLEARLFRNGSREVAYRRVWMPVPALQTSDDLRRGARG